MATAKTIPNKQDLPPVPYFYRSTYLYGDFEHGTIVTENDTRLVMLPEELIKGLHQAIEYETGRAWNIVAYSCGRQWGKRLLRTMQDEWRNYHSMQFDHSEYFIFESWIAEYFSFLGWGELEIDFSREDEGLVQFYLQHSVLDHLLADLEDDYVNEIFAGVLASMCTWLSGRELECLEVETPQRGAERSRMIVGLPERIERARKARLNGADVEEMVDVFLDDDA